jgi:hypothetical protein
MKQIQFQALKRFNLSFEDLSLEKQEYIEEEINKEGDVYGNNS